MNMKKTVLTLVVLGAGAAGAWFYFHGQGEAEAKGKDAAKGAGQGPTIVSMVPAVRQDVPVMLQANGTVVPVSTVDLHPQTTSTVREVHIKEGQFVKKGELMFSLDDRNEKAAIDKAQAQLVRDQATLADLERQYKRSQELLAQKFIAQSATDSLKSQVESARALIVGDNAAMQSARVAASYNQIHAPMAGRVGAIAVYPGSLVQLATSLTTITQLDPINLSFALPEAGLTDLLAAFKAGPVAVHASAGADSGAKEVVGHLAFVDNSVDASTGTIRVKAVFDNANASLWPGQYANARVTVRTLKDAVVVPQAAIITNTRGTFVYTIEADQTATQKPVARLYSFGLMAAVSGLDGSEKVITEGKQNLRPGAKVRLADAAPKGEGGAKGGGKHGSASASKKGSAS